MVKWGAKVTFLNKICKQLILFVLAGSALLGSGCIGPHYHEHQLVLFGRRHPRIRGPDDPAIAAHLTTKPWPRSVVGPEAGVGVTLFKAMGIQGWKDFHLHAQARGVEVQHEIASNGFLTLDMELKALTVQGVHVPIIPPKYMRVEIFLGKVTVDNSIRHETNEPVYAEGKLVWDEDGWFEIHPQRTGDVLRF